MRRVFFITMILGSICFSASLSSCSNDDDIQSTTEEKVNEQLSQMTLRDKIGQMFIIRLGSLDTLQVEDSVISITACPIYDLPQRLVEFDKQYPVGGVILYNKNIQDPAQLIQLTGDMHAKLQNDPLVCIDEEGGRVSRIANTPSFNLHKYASMQEIASSGNPQDAYDAAYYIGSYVKSYGFDIDFAPVADVNTNPENIVIGARCFSSNPDTAATFVLKYLDGLTAAKMMGCVKHFPGHGDVKNDTHTGYAATTKTWAQMDTCEMVTFRAAINAGVQLVMTAHIAVPNVDPTTYQGYSIPSTMSSVILQDKLRGSLGYQNVIITDGMDMGAITLHYSAEEAAIRTILAGVDIVLCPQNYRKAYDAVYQAVKDGRIPEERINQSVRRILKLKMQLHE